ncbi:MAG TPA: tetratricopeptide repeat protein [Terracidiphilus sp.]|nr:tetratricopeptide repeat protein [Terracidiphilus sp.]
MRKGSVPVVSTVLALASLFVTSMLLQAQQNALSPGEVTEAPSTSVASIASIPPPQLPPANTTVVSTATPAKSETTRLQTEFAVEALTRILADYRKSGNHSAEAHTLSALADSYSTLHQQQKAVELYQSALAIWRDLGDKQNQATMLAHIGDVYREWGFRDQAIHSYRDALKLYQGNYNKAEEAAVFNNLGLTYFVLGDKKKCLAYLGQAVASYHAQRDRRGEALTITNLGSTYAFLINDPHKALDFFQDAVTRLELLNDRASEANALDLMGELWLKLGKPELASLTFQHSLALYGALGDTQGQASVRRHMRNMVQPETIASTR